MHVSYLVCIPCMHAYTHIILCLIMHAFLQELRRGLALWGTPGFACISFGRGLTRCGMGFIGGLLDSSGRLFGSWFQCFEALARNADVFSVLPFAQGQGGGIADQPGSIAEGLV